MVDDIDSHMSIKFSVWVTLIYAIIQYNVISLNLVPYSIDIVSTPDAFANSQLKIAFKWQRYTFHILIHYHMSYIW